MTLTLADGTRFHGAVITELLGTADGQPVPLLVFSFIDQKAEPLDLLYGLLSPPSLGRIQAVNESGEPVMSYYGFTTVVNLKAILDDHLGRIIEVTLQKA